MVKNGILKQVINYVNSLYSKSLIYGGKVFFRRGYKKLLTQYPHKKFHSEKEYVSLWKPLQKAPDLSSYRLFAQYIGEQAEIVPEDILSGIIQPLLNPIKYRPFYQDKNSFDIILGVGATPKTLLRSMDGIFLDKDYRKVEILNQTLEDILKSEKKVFLKPSVDSSSGKGVVGFEKGLDGIFYSIDSYQILNSEYLLKYQLDNPDFILQRALTQHPKIALFNPSSVNTIRIATYRSVVDNKTHFLRAIIRIGKIGSFVDNAHAGGLFVGIDDKGKLGKYACDQYGNRYDEFNGINFRTNDYYIPNFSRIINFAEEIASKVLHARLLAQDICLEENGNPKIVEFNIRAFSAWLFQFTSGTAFGDYTQEIIDYCAKRKSSILKVFVEPF